ncbi:MAG: transposase [Nitrospirae bacterium]|nr:transposase [Nitrospirota bacterium]
MARPLRIEYDGAVYHVTSRGNARKPIYLDDADREMFLDALNKVNLKFNWLCHAYCLMNNHYHLVIETPDGNLSKGMRQLNGIYTQLFNRSHNRVGHIFQGRYKAILIQKETHLLEVCRYAVLNPVRARAAGQPEDWLWSSYRGTAGFEKPHPTVTTDWVLGRFGTKRKKAERRYREFVNAGIGEKNIWRDRVGQGLLGDEGFSGELKGYLKGVDGLKEIPKSQRYLGRPALGEIFAAELVGKKKQRNRMILDAVKRCGYSQNEIAAYLGLHYTTISRIVNKKA